VIRHLLSMTILLGVMPCLLPARTAAAAEPTAPESVVKCAECGMSAEVAGRFTARIVQRGNPLYFCDIGDLAAFIERTQPKEYTASVHDALSGEWIDVSEAFFVIDKKKFASPMGWGVAAFKDRTGAPGSPMNFESLRKALR